jgi:hypothetical protein
MLWEKKVGGHIDHYWKTKYLSTCRREQASPCTEHFSAQQMQYSWQWLLFFMDLPPFGLFLGKLASGGCW